MTQAKAVRRASQAGRRRVRTFKVGSARDTLGELTPGIELYCLTMGQFSLIDLLLAIMEQTGPAEVDCATWIAAQADLDVVEELLGRAEITRFRLLVDRSFVRMKPARCRRIEEMFGPGTIRSAGNHSKFLRISNDSWSIAVRTSMNLNQNPRIESFELSDCPTLSGFLRSVMDEIFANHPPGDFNVAQNNLRGVKQSKRSGAVECGTIAFADTPRLDKLRGSGEVSLFAGMDDGESESEGT